MPAATIPLPEYGSGVHEIGEDCDTDTYRLIFMLGLQQGVYILHFFKKKSTSGKSHPKRDKEVIRQRVKDARAYDVRC